MTPAAPQPIPWIDRKLLVEDTALSIASAVISSALGASWLGSLTPKPRTTPPVFTGPSTIVVDTNELEGTPVTYPRPPAVDSNGRRARVACSPTTVPAGTRAQVGCTATDRVGQTTQGSFVVWIRIVDPG